MQLFILININNKIDGGYNLKRKGIIRTISTYALLILIAIYFVTMLESTATKEISYTEFMQRVTEKKVKSVTIDNSTNECL